MTIKYSSCCLAYGVALLALTLSSSAVGQEGAEAKAKIEKLRVYVGTYTGPKSKGIYHFDLDLASGEMTPAGETEGIVNPSFLAIHPSRRFLYAVAEIGDFKGTKTGGVAAFAVDTESGKLTALNQQSSGGSGPCHLTVDRQGKCVLVANYGGGSVAALPIGEDGTLGEATAFIQHKDDGDGKRKPRGHSINVDAANRFAMAADLGLDKVLIYKLDAAKGTLTPNDPPAGVVPPGSGPRHFAFHPGGRFAYVINESSSTMTAFSYDAERGALQEIQTLSTLPKPHPGNSTAEVQVHPSGKFLYGSNRGHDSIAIFSIDPETGRLTAVGHQSTEGKTPRNFGVDPTGAYLLACNQNSGTIVVFRIDPKTGELKSTGKPVSVPSPVCVKFLQLGK